MSVDNLNYPMMETEFKKKLREDERQFYEAQAVAKIGSWEYDVRYNYLIWSNELYKMFEIQKPQPQKSLNKLYRSKIHPDDLKSLDQLIERTLKSGMGYVFQYRLCLEGKRIKYIEEVGKVIKDDAGYILSLSGTRQDVTEQKTSQEKLHELNQFINEAALISITNTNGEITFVNDKFIEISGYTKEELLGANHRIVASGAHDKEFFREMWETIIAGKTWHGEICNRTKKGKLYWIRATIAAGKDDQGNTQFMSIRFDITKEKKAEKKLMKSEELWKFVLDGAGDGVWDWNIQCGEVQFSKRWKEMLGFEEYELEGDLEEWKGRVHPDDLPRVLANIQEHLEGRGAYSIEHRILCKDGKYKWILARGRLVSRTAEGLPLRMIGTNTDLSRIKLAEQKLIQASKLASLGEMSAGIAHEINNPIAIIVGSAELLQKVANNPENLKAKVEVIQKSCERITRIVNGLKKFSRSSEKHNYTSRSLAAIVRESISLTEVKAHRNETLVYCDIKSDAHILCDEVEIEQVIINLSSNAIDATKEKKEKWVKIEVLDEDSSVVLRVTDSGTGIPEDIRNRLFEPFFTTKSVGEGTGLGLSIAKGILDEHKATISVIVDHPNTCFEVRFQKAEKAYAN